MVTSKVDEKMIHVTNSVESYWQGGFGLSVKLSTDETFYL